MAEDGSYKRYAEAAGLDQSLTSSVTTSSSVASGPTEWGANRQAIESVRQRLLEKLQSEKQKKAENHNAASDVPPAASTAEFRPPLQEVNVRERSREANKVQSRAREKSASQEHPDHVQPSISFSNKGSRVMGPPSLSDTRTSAMSLEQSASQEVHLVRSRLRDQHASQERPQHVQSSVSISSRESRTMGPPSLSDTRTSAMFLEKSVRRQAERTAARARKQQEILSRVHAERSATEAVAKKQDDTSSEPKESEKGPASQVSETQGATAKLRQTPKTAAEERKPQETRSRKQADGSATEPPSRKQDETLATRQAPKTAAEEKKPQETRSRKQADGREPPSRKQNETLATPNFDPRRFSTPSVQPSQKSRQHEGNGSSSDSVLSRRRLMTRMQSEQPVNIPEEEEPAKVPSPVRPVEKSAGTAGKAAPKNIRRKAKRAEEVEPRTASPVFAASSEDDDTPPCPLITRQAPAQRSCNAGPIAASPSGGRQVGGKGTAKNDAQQNASDLKQKVEPETISQRTRSGGRPPLSSRRRKEPPQKATQFTREGPLLKEINRLQGHPGLLIPRLPFSRLVREITMQMTGPTADYRYSNEALTALQTSTEYYLTGLFTDAVRVAWHAHRVTVMPKDLELLKMLGLTEQ